MDLPPPPAGWTRLPASKNMISLNSGHKVSELEIFCSMALVFKENPPTGNDLDLLRIILMMVLMRTILKWQRTGMLDM